MKNEQKNFYKNTLKVYKITRKEKMSMEKDRNLEFEVTSNCEVNSVNRSEKLNKNLCVRLKKIEGQVKGISGMVEKGVYCDDILTQISAVKSALSSVSKLLLESHIKTCVTEKIKNNDEDVIEEFIKTVGRMI